VRPSPANGDTRAWVRFQVGGAQFRSLACVSHSLEDGQMAVDGGALVVSVLLTAVLGAGAVAIGILLNRKLFPNPERTPQQTATLRRFKLLLLCYLAGLLLLGGLVSWLTGNLLAGFGVALAVMVVLQFIAFGLVTHRKSQLSKAKTRRPT
jgi:hypothetical protein